MNDRFRNELKAYAMSAKAYVLGVIDLPHGYDPRFGTPILILRSEIDIWIEKYGDKLKILVD